MATTDGMIICQIAAHAILVDNRLTDAELTLLNELMDKYELDEDERKQVRACNLEEDLSSLLANYGGSLDVNDVLHEIVRAVVVDGEIAARERDFLNSLAARLAVPQHELEALLAKVTDR